MNNAVVAIYTQKPQAEQESTTLNALRLETTLKRCMKAKQFISALNDDDLTKVLDLLFNEASLNKGLSAD